MEMKYEDSDHDRYELTFNSMLGRQMQLPEFCHEAQNKNLQKNVDSRVRTCAGEAQQISSLSP